jgi:hypothetical protein
MTTSYWVVCLTAIATSLVLLVKLGAGRELLARDQLWRHRLTSRESLYGRVALILLASGLGLALFGVILELLLEE